MKKFACLLVALVAISSAKADIIIDSLSRMTFTPIININNEHNPLSGIELQYYNSIQNTILPFRIFQQNNATWLKWVSLPGTIGLRSMSINTNGYVRMGDFGTGNSYSYAYPQMLTIHNQSGVGLHIEAFIAFSNAAILISRAWFSCFSCSSRLAAISFCFLSSLGKPTTLLKTKVTVKDSITDPAAPIIFNNHVGMIRCSPY